MNEDFLETGGSEGGCRSAEKGVGCQDGGGAGNLFEFSAKRDSIQHERYGEILIGGYNACAVVLASWCGG